MLVEDAALADRCEPGDALQHRARVEHPARFAAGDDHQHGAGAASKSSAASDRRAPGPKTGAKLARSDTASSMWFRRLASST